MKGARAATGLSRSAGCASQLDHNEWGQHLGRFQRGGASECWARHGFSQDKEQNLDSTARHDMPARHCLSWGHMRVLALSSGVAWFYEQYRHGYSGYMSGIDMDILNAMTCDELHNRSL